MSPQRATHSPFDVTGKVFLITGGTEGIGRGMAQRLLDAGASVMLAARDADRGQRVVDELAHLSDRVAFVQTDLKQAADVQRAVASSVERFGRLDGAINNAATVGTVKPIIDTSPEEFDDVIATNLRGVFLCIKYEIEQFLRQGACSDGYSIVNVGSSAVRRLQPAIAPYVSSKLAIEGLTRAAAFEYAGQGIRTNALVFGVFDTPLSRAFYAQNPEVRAVNLSQHRVGRFGDCIEDAGTAALYLLSRASAFMAGSIFELDGGLHL